MGNKSYIHDEILDSRHDQIRDSPFAIFLSNNSINSVYEILNN